MPDNIFDGGTPKGSKEANPFKNQESINHQAPEAKSKETVAVEASSMAQLLSVMGKVLEKMGTQQIDYNKLSESMAKAISKSNKDDEGENAMYEVEEITSEDYLEKPAVFFAYSYGTIILDDIRYGKVAKCPVGPIKFRPLYRYVKPDGKTVSMCMAVVSSKRQAEFVRTHTRFGIQYFEEASTQKTIDASFQEKLVSAYNIINSKPEFEVHRMALQMNVKIDTTDINEIKRRVAHAKALLMQNDEDILHKNTYKIQVETGDSEVGNAEKDLIQKFMS